MTEQDPIKIKVEPTKELFVHILTRDIFHYAAITELVDDSVDGAKRIAENKDRLSDFWVNVEFDGEAKPIIHDNCGALVP